jgi:hypothetical protein
MANFDDHDPAFGIVDGIENAIVALPNSILLVTRELLTTVRPRVLGEPSDSRNQAFAVLECDCLEILDRRRLDLESIACHDA